MKNLARTSHQLSAVAGDAQHPAGFSHFGVLDVLSSTTPRPSGRKRHWARHLADLATKAGEKYGLIVFVALSLLASGCSSSSSSDPDLDAWEREVEVIIPAAIGERQYEELGGMLEVREVIRASYGSEDQAVDTAKRELRRLAAKLDADAVVIVECGRHVRPVEETSLPSMGPEVVCHGFAIRWMD